MLTMKDIIREGHPTLQKNASEVSLPMSDIDKKTLFSMMEFVKLSQDEETSQKYNLRPGVGLAAPQINVSKRMIAIHSTNEDNKLFSYMLVNPKIVSHSVEQTYLMPGEGCLSVDREVPGYVFRPKRITVKGFQLKENGDLTPVSLRLKGYIAIVFQHEIDHLNGVLFTERINKENPFLVPQDIKPIDF
ncbi:peptide deformylase [Mycoplasmatota bacterium]|nr:peptide deformylase [Mycoplasmatota bacterium]